MILRYLAFLIVSSTLLAEEPLTWSKTTQINDIFVNQSGMTLTYIPAGAFMMGSPEGEPYRTNGEKLHKVTLTQSFLMGVTEVTQEEFQKVMKVSMKDLFQRRTAEDSKRKESTKQKLRKMSGAGRRAYQEKIKQERNELKYPGGARQAPKVKPTKEQNAQKKITAQEVNALKEQYKKDKAEGQHISYGNDFPVGFVSWSEAVEFCQKLTNLERSSGKLPQNWSYRLPTGAEWEYACRAGTKTAVFTGKQPDTIDRASVVEFKKYAWSNTNSGNKAHKVAQLKPNPWGLYDIYGNVSEWCLDIYSPYTGEEQRDPLSMKGPGMMRVNRGLNSHCTMTGFRSAHRKTGGPQMPYYCFFGFRIVCAPVTALTSNVPDNHNNR